MIEIRERTVDVRGVRLHLVEAGEGPLVLLLHGFPEFSYEWRHQLAPLAAAGFHVVTPDQRGYGRSDKPRRRRDYRIEQLAADIEALIASLGHERATVVGHDSGGMVAYCLAMFRPECVERLVIVNAPHPAEFERLLRRSVRQVLRSWYMLFFVLPVIPELALRAGRWFVLRRLLEGDARPGAFTAHDLERYLEAWARPGAIKAALDWYRAFLIRRPRSLRRRWRVIEQPTLVLWGDRDRHLMPELAEPRAGWVPRRTTVRFPHASHWLPHEEPARVTEAILKFVGSPHGPG